MVICHKAAKQYKDMKKSTDMKLKILMMAAISVLVFIATCAEAFAQQQQQEGPDIFEQAEMEADRLQRVLELADWQTFYVDSTLKHDFPAMMAEYEQLRQSKVSNTSLYQDVRDKWLDQIDATYKRIFTEEQWAAYLKQGAGKAQKARAKRREKAQGK
jgi:hypothetical protein